MPIDFSPLPPRLLVVVFAVDTLVIALAWTFVHLGAWPRWVAIALTVFNVVTFIIQMLQTWLQKPPETTEESAP